MALTKYCIPLFGDRVFVLYDGVTFLEEKLDKDDGWMPIDGIEGGLHIPGDDIKVLSKTK